jgi:hypothetical protein
VKDLEKLKMEAALMLCKVSLLPGEDLFEAKGSCENAFLSLRPSARFGSVQGLMHNGANVACWCLNALTPFCCPDYLYLLY